MYGLAANTVRLWRAPLNHPSAVVDAAADLLSPSERIRAARGSAAVERRRVLARAALRSVLGFYAGTAPEAVRIEYGAFGKPRLPKSDSSRCVRFNLSTTADVCLIAVTADEVGIDVERIARRSGLDQLASRFFAEDEVNAIRQRRGDEKLRAFFQTWTLKEALVKADGRGLSLPLTDFTVSLREGAQVVKVNGGESWTVATLSIDPEVAAAVALRGVTSAEPALTLTNLRWTGRSFGPAPEAST